MTTAESNAPARPGNYHRVALAAHALVYDTGGRLLVIRRSGTKYLDGYWSVPAGHIDEGETAVGACVREVGEEVGLTLAADELEFLLVQQKSAKDGEERVDFFFKATWDGSEQPRVGAPYELDAVRWVYPTDLPEPFAPYVLSALRAISGQRRLSTWGLD